MNSDKPIVITLTVNPIKNGKREIVVSGAPDGEMPVLRSGQFSDVHALVDQVWIELAKRKPQVVTKPKESSTSAKPKAAATRQPDMIAEAQAKMSASIAAEGAAATADEGADQLVRSDTETTELPEIENDTAAEEEEEEQSDG